MFPECLILGVEWWLESLLLLSLFKSYALLLIKLLALVQWICPLVPTLRWLMWCQRFTVCSLSVKSSWQLSRWLVSLVSLCVLIRSKEECAALALRLLRLWCLLECLLRLGLCQTGGMLAAWALVFVIVPWFWTVVDFLFLLLIVLFLQVELVLHLFLLLPWKIHVITLSMVHHRVLSALRLLLLQCHLQLNFLHYIFLFFQKHVN